MKPIDYNDPSEKELTLRLPKRYRVVLYKDKETPRHFILLLLMRHFQKSIHQSKELVEELEEKGFVSAGTYTHEIAETKSTKVLILAKKNSYPLKCSFEPE